MGGLCEKKHIFYFNHIPNNILGFSFNCEKERTYADVGR